LRAVHELLSAQRRRVRRVLVARARDGDQERDAIVALAERAGVRVEIVGAERVLDEARLEVPQGIVALADPVEPVALETLLATPNCFLVVLDGVTDPRNLGAVLRTAEAAGVTGVVLPRHRSALLTPAAVKAAAGAIEHVAIALVPGIPNALDQARRAEVWTVGIDMAGTTSIFELTVADAALALVLGSEGRGLARLTRDRCDVLASIPMRGTLESLNVSAAAAVACFEVVRRRGR
jgi:23S rRNA (guanosine2251-2'-O)-methyltransferase